MASGDAHLDPPELLASVLSRLAPSSDGQLHLNETGCVRAGLEELAHYFATLVGLG